MYDHHKKAIEDITNKLKVKEEILGIIMGGSVAHGFANKESDIDIMNNFIDDKSEKNANSLYELIMNFNKWESESKPWNIQFMIDSELTWLDGFVPVGDI